MKQRPIVNYHELNLEALKDELKRIRQPTVLRAIDFAEKHHDKQVDRVYKDTPYVLHALRVGCLISKWIPAPDVIAAAILHDILEKTKVTAKTLVLEFNLEIRTIVETVTEFEKKRDDWRFGKEKKIRRLPTMPLNVLRITFAERFDRMFSLHQNVEKFGKKIWQKLCKNKEDIEWYFGDLSFFIPIYSELNIAPYILEYGRLYKEVFKTDIKGIRLPVS